MPLNCQPNCYCCSNFCNSICCPPSCFCCPICRRRNQLKPLKMSLKSKTSSSGTAAATKVASTKSRPKSIKAKKVIRSDKPKALENALTHDDSPSKNGKTKGSRQNLHSSSSSLLRNSACPRVEKGDPKQVHHLNISLPQTRPEECNGSNGSAKGNQSGRDSTSDSATNQPLTSNNNNNKSLAAKTKMSVQAYKEKLALMCSCCNKASPMYSSASSPNSSRHSLSVTKSGSQLDVIAEVDSEAENNRKPCSSAEDCATLENFWNAKGLAEKVQRSCRCCRNQDTPTSQTSREKMQKSLEDSCADFLNIVCDNVMESVQKSVDCKLKEFIVHATEHFTTLAQKLEENGAAMKMLFEAEAEKMAERNKRNFEDFYLRVEDLMEKQGDAKSNKTRDSESQFEEVADEKETEHLAHNERERDTSDSQENLLKCDACDCCIDEEDNCRPCNINETRNETAVNPDNETRQSGGCDEDKAAARGGENEIPKRWNSFNAIPTKTVANLRPTNSQKINCFSDSSTPSQDSDENEMKVCNGKSKKLPIVDADYYDTSGYATEPEDNSGEIGRKRLQKKSLKQHSLKRQTAAAINMEDVHNEGQELSEKNSVQTMKRLSRSSFKSCSSSPTRLSRL